MLELTTRLIGGPRDGEVITLSPYTNCRFCCSEELPGVIVRAWYQVADYDPRLAHYVETTLD